MQAANQNRSTWTATEAPQGSHWTATEAPQGRHWTVNQLPSRTNRVPQPIATAANVAVATAIASRPANTRPRANGERAVDCAHINPDTGRQCGNRTRNPPLCAVHQRMQERSHPTPVTISAPVSVQTLLPPPPTVPTGAARASTGTRPNRLPTTAPPPPLQVAPKTKRDTCPCCQDECMLKLFKCGHGVCDECRGQMRDITCPLCRAVVNKDLEGEECQLIVQRLVDDKLDRKVQGIQAQVVAAYKMDLVKIQQKHKNEIDNIRKEYQSIIAAMSDALTPTDNTR